MSDGGIREEEDEEEEEEKEEEEEGKRGARVGRPRGKRDTKRVHAINVSLTKID